MTTPRHSLKDILLTQPRNCHNVQVCSEMKQYQLQRSVNKTQVQPSISLYLDHQLKKRRPGGISNRRKCLSFGISDYTSWQVNASVWQMGLTQWQILVSTALPADAIIPLQLCVAFWVNVYIQPLCSNYGNLIGYVQRADNPKKSTNEKSGWIHLFGFSERFNFLKIEKKN